jgi:hypothetical protein
MTQLFVTDGGDFSVGLPDLTYLVDCPVLVDDPNNITEEEYRELERFRHHIIMLYQDYAEGRVTADYDFETIDIDEDE